MEKQDVDDEDADEPFFPCFRLGCSSDTPEAPLVGLRAILGDSHHDGLGPAARLDGLWL
jgi:hypothetical protein